MKQKATPAVRYASAWIRLGAGVIDMLVTMMAAGLIMAPAVVIILLQGASQPASIPSILLSVGFMAMGLIPLCNEVILPITRWQGTVGQRLVGIYIADRNGRKLGFFRCAARVVVFYACFFLPDIFFEEGNLNNALQLALFLAMTVSIFFTQERVTLYDMLCGTRLHYGRPWETPTPRKSASRPKSKKTTKAKARR